MQYDAQLKQAEVQDTNSVFKLPQGLFGFPDLTEMEIVFDQEELPFMWLRELHPEGMAFVVLEPNGIIPDYIIEIPDADVEYLEIIEDEIPFILNIVTLGNTEKGEHITANLVGPLVINRRTRRGKQIIINNHDKYSARFSLTEAAEQGTTAC
ncbi:MAG: flagellar assembly protein FliW [Opitutae bacterium]|jgi:flagellar assembly factor FliW|nr:flagellar assembly protein FliW [Opitutae bacterium]